MMNNFLSVDPKSVSTPAFHHYLLGAVAPRPIAFASTIDAKGNVNLSPFSFFNAFGANPPTLIFSPARRVRDNTTKHSLENVLEVPEVVINIVDFKMVEQMSLASCEYEKGVNEFVKAGLTELPSDRVKPPRVAESPASFECIVKQVIQTGTEGGAGNLIICEVVMAHFREDILDSDGKIDTTKLDPVARMGGDWYCRAHGAALFEVPKPNLKLGIGIDQLPESIKSSPVLSGNNLGRLANIERLPNQDEILTFKHSGLYEKLIGSGANTEEVHKVAKNLIEAGLVEDAWKILLG